MITEDCAEQAIAALAAGASMNDAAAVGSMSVRTLRRRLDDPAFAGRLQLKRKVLSEEIDASLRALGRQAALVLERTMQPGQPLALQLRAAIASLQMWSRNRDFELEERVASVEAIFEAQESTVQTLADAIELVKAEVRDSPLRGEAGEQ